MILDIPPHVEQVLTTKAQAQGQSVQDFILMCAYEKALQSADNQSVVDFFSQSKPLDIFKEIDPVAYQRAMRDEWA